MKTFKKILSEVAQPKAGDEINFKDKHEIEMYDYPVDVEDQFTSDKKKAKARRADYDDRDDMKVYEGMDPVDKDAVKKPFRMRKDKDIDNDGDVDDSDRYLHARRAAVTKAIQKMKEAAGLEEAYAIYYKGSVFDTFDSMEDAKDAMTGMDLSASEKKDYKIRKVAGKSGAKMTGKMMKEGGNLDEMKQPYVVIDTADDDRVVAMASDEKGAQQSINSSERPPMSIKNKSTLKIVKTRKKQNIGRPLNEDLTEKAVSQAQQKLMGMALAYKRGEMDDASDEVKELAKSMSEKDLEDFAKTKHKGLPKKINEARQPKWKVKVGNKHYTVTARNTAEANRKAESIARKEGNIGVSTGKIVKLDEDAWEEIPMMTRQLAFIEYAAEEISDYLSMDIDPEEWFQNKLAHVHGQMRTLHAYIEGDKRMMGAKMNYSPMGENLDEAANKLVARYMNKSGSNVLYLEIYEKPNGNYIYTIKNQRGINTSASSIDLKSSHANAKKNVDRVTMYYDQDGDSGALKFLNSLLPGWKKAPINEETQLDEISKKTLGSYIKKAKTDVAGQAYQLGARDPLKPKASWSKALGREKYIDKAVDRLTKEEAELDEVSFELAKRARDKGFEKMAKSIGTTKKTKYGTNEYVPATDQEMKDAEKGARQAKLASRAMTRAFNKQRTGKYESVDLTEAFKTGTLKLKDGSTVSVSKQDADLLNQMMKDLNAKNRKEMEKIAMADEAGFEEILGFAREAL